MAAIRPVQLEGPLTFSANVNINGGQLVEPDGAGPASPMLVKPAAALSIKCLGVAISDAAAAGYAQGTVDAWGNPIYAAQFPPNEVAVAYEGVWRITASAIIVFGELVSCGVNGTVVPTAANTAFTVIGRCVDPLGIANGVRGKILLGSVGSA